MNKYDRVRVADELGRGDGNDVINSGPRGFAISKAGLDEDRAAVSAEEFIGPKLTQNSGVRHWQTTSKLPILERHKSFTDNIAQ